MKDTITYFIIILILIGVLSIPIAWNIYAFKDCKKVGHSTLYCIGRIGK